MKERLHREDMVGEGIYRSDPFRENAEPDIQHLSPFPLVVVVFHPVKVSGTAQIHVSVGFVFN